MLIPVICGATGSGKSGLAYQIFDRLEFELISADAFQIYRKLDIGTAKPCMEIRKGIVHHQIDIVPPDGSYTAGDYFIDTEIIIKNILSRGKVPVIVGGTGLYIQSLSEGMFEVPPADTQYRRELSLIAAEKGSAYLHGLLKKVDPVYASKIHENDLMRITRGLEVCKTTGLPISQAHIELRRKPVFKYDLMALNTEREKLYEKINERTEKMIIEGWPEEVESLLADGYDESLPSFRAIGYRELAAVVKGTAVLDEAAALISQKTRNYAKRQMTWYRGMKNVRFMNEKEIVENIIKSY